jgi:hypothetical protein
MKNIIVISTFLLFSCSRTTILGKNEVAVDNIISIKTPVLKEKSGYFAGEFVLTNLSDSQSIIINLTDISCKWGDQMGLIRYTLPFNIGEKKIDIKPHESKTAKLRCNVQSSGKGLKIVTISSIYSNPTNDGKTFGKMIAKDVSWSSE